MSDRVARMVEEAESRIHDADLLAESLQAQSDSQAQLKILALEVLLKALQVKTHGRSTRTHHYADLWQSLPADTRTKVLGVAKDRYPGHTNLGNIEKLLSVYEFIFTRARYGYELYDELSLAEQQSLGEEWVARGAPVEEADVQYFPMELSALLHGLCTVARDAA